MVSIAKMMWYNQFMNKKILYLIVALIAVAVLFTIIFNNKQSTVYAKDPYNATYVIDGTSVHLVDGAFESGTGPASSKTITRYFGKEARGDLNSDGREDVVFVITKQGPGTGTFYYVVAGLNDERGYHGTQGFLLGDRITPQSTSVQGNTVVVNYLDRHADEPFTVAPSVGKSKTLALDPKTLALGEATQPSVSGTPAPAPGSVAPVTSGTQTGSKLIGRKWEWINETSKAGVIATTSRPGAFTITLASGGKFSATTDCNQIGGTYSVSGGSLTFNSTYSTKMHCGSVDEDRFKQFLTDARTYKIANSKLFIYLKDGGSLAFR
jgi:heat shock protein HslJ